MATKKPRPIPTLEVVKALGGRTGILSVDDGRKDQIHVRVRVRDVRINYGRLELLVQPIYGLGQTWVTYRIYRGSHSKGFTSRLKLEE